LHGLSRAVRLDYHAGEDEIVRRSAKLAFVLVLVAGGACSKAAPNIDASPRGGGSPTATAAPSASTAADTLVGDWDTGPFSTHQYGGTKFEFNVRFYDEGGVPFVVMTGWDPTMGAMPQDGDHGPYKLVGSHRIDIASADNPDISTTYSYELNGDQLTLTWIHNDPNAPPEDQGGPFATIRLFRS